MQPDEKRAARTEWKERKDPAGIYAMRGAAGAWVGYATDVPAAQNKLDFTLRMGSARPMTLQSAWTAAQGRGFVFELLESVPQDMPQVARPRWGKDRRALWAARLGAALI